MLSAFITLLVTIGPMETAPIFASLAPADGRAARRLALRGVLFAALVLYLFALVGRFVLGWMHVSLASFQVAGGVLLFLQALTLIFSSPGLSSINRGETLEAEQADDIAVFPLAFPLIAGPGALSAVVLLMNQAPDWRERMIILACLTACLIITFVALLTARRLTAWLGKTGTDVVGRISGVLLAALAVQFVFDGWGMALPG